LAAVSISNNTHPERRRQIAPIMMFLMIAV